jgi:hypothetical protein
MFHSIADVEIHPELVGRSSQLQLISFHWVSCLSPIFSLEEEEKDTRRVASRGRKSSVSSVALVK